MNRNTKSFDNNAVSIDIRRSTFNRNSSVKLSFNAGDVVPFYVDEVLPGDTFNINTSKIVRLQTLLTPLMDNIYLDTYFFFVPNRIIWEHWKEFNGENKDSAWIPQVEYEIPQIVSPSDNGWEVGTIADYFGIPTGVPGLSVNALPFRAYAKIIDEWFRDQNLQQPLNIPVNDTTLTGVNTGDFVTDIVKGGKPFIASKYRDYFTSCLPAPQKGPDVGIGLSGDADVFGNGTTMAFTDGSKTVGFKLSSSYPTPYQDLINKPIGSSGDTSTSAGGSLGLVTKDSGIESGLIADLSTSSTISINSLRMAFQLQRLYEKDARGGSRYIEIIKAHFGVTSPDARQQRPEYLGGNRIPININQVVQMSETGNTPMGDTAGMSVTADSHSDFTKSFTEHGYIIGLLVARYDHTYQQGLERLWSRKDRFDFYWPALANIGEQAVKNKEIYATGTATDDEVFGYQEAWADYRYKPSRVAGEMRSSYATSLDVWHLGDDYSELPTLSDGWIREDKSNIDRVLAVQSSVSNQFFADIYVMNKTTRPMPLHSVPGFIDHF
jgi:hypothetical protein